MDMQHNNTQMTGVKQHLTLGLVAWVLLGGLTAALDSQSAGIISLFGGIGAWSATAIGLALAYMAAFAAYRHRGWTAAGVVGGVSALLVGTLLAAIDWNGVMQGILTLAGIGALIALVTKAPPSALSASADDSEDGASYPHWRNNGLFGPGWYVGNMPLEDDDD